MKPVSNKPQFEAILRSRLRPPSPPSHAEEVERREVPFVPQLFGFLLFDSRRAHRPIQEFLVEEFDWLDQQAGAAHMLMFGYKPGDKDSESRNPSLQVGADFGIRPSDLPGVALFSNIKGEPSEAIYLPMPVELFEQQGREASRVIDDLFTVIQECRTSSDTAEGLLKDIRRRVKKLKRDEKTRPIAQWLRQETVELGRLPRLAIMAAATGFGTALGAQPF
jgi:hypothetical protein